jgi:hypothetical protein
MYHRSDMKDPRRGDERWPQAASDLRRRLERLEEKYTILSDLRARREAAEGSGAVGFAEEESRERRRVFAAIAREFPGALREMERATHEQLEARRREVREEIEEIRPGPSPPCPRRRWVAVVLDYHALLREALAIRQWLVRNVPPGGAIDEVLLQVFSRWHRGSAVRHTEASAFDAAALARYRRPPGGRLHAVVWERLERRYGLDRGRLEEIVFPSGPGTRDAGG